uniref:RING-type domain-containing protein n=1 Tax=Leersia perrieri TaxID=77586 RepID=A0A0D9VUL4_9ORYZ
MAEDDGGGLIPSRAELATRFRSISDRLQQNLDASPSIPTIVGRLRSAADQLDRRHQQQQQQQQQQVTTTGGNLDAMGEESRRRRTAAEFLNSRLEYWVTYHSTPPPNSSGAGPASKEAIEALKDVVEQPPSECAICLQDTGDAAAAAGWKEMPSGHQFHGGCLEKWLHVRGMCPTCRHQMPTTPVPAPAPPRAIELGGGDLFNELYAWAPPAMSSRINLQSATAIDALGDVADNDGQDCAICLHEDDTAVAWKETPCGHRFHRGCLEKWLQAAHGHDTCPMCRRKILPEAASGVMASKVGMTFAHGQMVVLTQYEGGGEHLRYRPLADLLNEPADGSRYSSISYVVGRGGAAPASEEAIEALKDVDDQPPAAECAICLHHQGDAAGAAGWKEMPCEHRFHGGCLVRWLRVHGTCPMCRHRMPTVDEEEEVEMEEVVEPVESGEADGGTMEEAIQSLEDVDMTNGGGLQLECAICLDHGEEAAAGWKAMPCGHRFHGGELRRQPAAVNLVMIRIHFSVLEHIYVDGAEKTTMSPTESSDDGVRYE